MPTFIFSGFQGNYFPEKNQILNENSTKFKDGLILIPPNGIEFHEHPKELKKLIRDEKNAEKIYHLLNSDDWLFVSKHSTKIEVIGFTLTDKLILEYLIQDIEIISLLSNKLLGRKLLSSILPNVDINK